MRYSEWLSTARKTDGRSQEALAAACGELDKRVGPPENGPRRSREEAGVSQARVSEWERGATVPSFRQHVLIERVLGLEPAAVEVARAVWQEAHAGGLLDIGTGHRSPNTETMTDAAVTGEPEGVTVGAGVP